MMEMCFDVFGACILQDKNICGDKLSEVAQNGNKLLNFYFIFSIILALPSKICKTHNKWVLQYAELNDRIEQSLTISRIKIYQFYH